MKQQSLTATILKNAVKELCERDNDLLSIQTTFGSPPLWEREPGFATLLLIILEQQVSLASARATFQKLQQRILQVTPEAVLTLDDVAMKAIGFSRQKMHYARLLAEAMASQRFNLAALATMEDEHAHAELVQLKGIGRWSADVYLMMALRRPDIWPIHDLALAIAAQHVKRLRKRPSPERLEALGKAWRPWRSVAARMLWHFYLSGGAKRNAKAARNKASVEASK